MKSSCIEPTKLYERDTKLKKQDVQILQEWLKKQPHLPSLEETQVILFLHSCYYSIEFTKTTIDVYFTRRTLYPEMFLCPEEDSLKKLLDLCCATVLPKKTPEGCMVSTFKLRDLKPENYTFSKVTLLINLVNGLYWHQEGFSEGLIGIIDMKGFTLGHLARVNLAALKNAFAHLQEGAPIRLKGMHLLNVVSFMDKISTLVKPLISGKIFNMMQLHSSVDSLHKFIPKECLPEDYGGELSSFEILHKETEKTIFENLDFYKWHDSQTVNEAKRVEKSSVVGSNLGIEGTFKKLQID